jgi:hypothetical protein
MSGSLWGLPLILFKKFFYLLFIFLFFQELVAWVTAQFASESECGIDNYA